jgi:hypothetical protein
MAVAAKVVQNLYRAIYLNSKIRDRRSLACGFKGRPFSTIDLVRGLVHPARQTEAEISS